MASLTLKNLPEELLERLRRRAAEDRRSLNQQAIYLLERALAELDVAAEAQAQAEAWRHLAGRWRSDRPARDEVDELRASRSAGRPVNL